MVRTQLIILFSCVFTLYNPWCPVVRIIVVVHCSLGEIALVQVSL